MEIIRRNLSTFWKGTKQTFEWLSMGMGIWVVILLGSWLLITLARSATLGFGIAVAGIAVGAGIGCGIYFIFKHRKIE